MDVMLYLVTPVVLALGGYALWLAHKVDQADARRRQLPSDAAHHPAE